MVADLSSDPRSRADRRRSASLATAYERDNAATGELVVEDCPDRRWSWLPVFEGGAAGSSRPPTTILPSPSALLAGGSDHGERVLSRPPVTLMTSDQLTAAQKAVSGFCRGTSTPWAGFRDVGTHPPHAPRPLGRQLRLVRLLGIAWCIDPAEDMTTIFIVRRAHASDPEAAGVARHLDRCLPGN